MKDILLNRFYLDKEKDIIVNLYKINKDEIKYILETPNHNKWSNRNKSQNPSNFKNLNVTN